jgi:kinesin family protein 5
MSSLPNQNSLLSNNNTNNNINTQSQITEPSQNQTTTKPINTSSSPLTQPESQRFNILIRIRPVIPHDSVELTTEEELKPCIFKRNQNKLFLQNEKTDKDYEMLFDHVMDATSDQADIYDTFGDRLVRDVFKGYNGTIMAYGQTGSGKSYTVFGSDINECEDDNSYEKKQGIVQRAINQIFEYKEKNKKIKSVNVFVSFMQVYLNQITDLLTNTKDIAFNNNDPVFKLRKETKNLSIKNSLNIVHDKNGVYVRDLTIREVSTADELLDVISKGIESRVTSQTTMNKYSSRSHAIVQIIIKQKWIERLKNTSTNEIVDKLHKLQGILTIVDLAGSESVSRSGSEGLNQDEAKEINKSISALGRVIETLSKNSKFNKNTHVSYRDSKLTELLSECLGGNSKTVIVACVSPCAANCEETYSTLQFASRAMIIETKPKRYEKIDTKKFNDNRNNGNSNNNGWKGEFNNGIDNIENLGRIDMKLKNDKRRFNDNVVSIEKRLNDMREKFDNIKRGHSYDIKGTKNTMDNINNTTNINTNNINIINSSISNRNAAIGNKEDFKNITRKFYSMIVHLQEELGKLTVKNYALEEENNFLKEQLKIYK